MPQGSHGRWEPDLDADERTMLTGFLDYHRATVVWRASGLTKLQMATTVGASSLAIAGILKHLALVEDSWFTERFAGRDVPLWSGVDWDLDPDWEFHSALDDEPAELLALYDQACERSRGVLAAAASLDQPSVAQDRQTGAPYTLRWILMHMIEETARHNGHLDLLREAIDGQTGE